MLFEDLEGVNWEVIGLSEVRSTREASVVLKNGYVLWYHESVDRTELRVGFLMPNNIAGNIGKRYSIRERVKSIVVKFHKKCMFY